MAKINEEVLVIKISTLTADGEGAVSNITEELVATLKSVTLELVDNGAVVEVIDGQ